MLFESQPEEQLLGTEPTSKHRALTLATEHGRGVKSNLCLGESAVSCELWEVPGC